MYFFIGKLTDYMRIGEIFPIYSWQLFSFVPQKSITEFAIQIQETSALFQAPSVAAHTLIQKLGKAQTRNNSIKVEQFRKEFEEYYLKQPVKYDLILITFNPLERWRNGTYQKTYLKTFP